MARLHTPFVPALRVAAMVATLLGTGCTFDDADLAERDACRRDADCVQGVCRLGRCRPADDPLLSEPDTDLDALGPDDPESPADVLPMDPAPLPDASPPPSDAPAPPVCPSGPPNACGGCAPLGADRGAPCNDCSGAWTCADTDALVCAGASTNVCGGCASIQRVTPGSLCACPDADPTDPHRWRCTDDDLICTDANSTARQATDLGSDDAGAEPRVFDPALLAVRGDIDYFSFAVRSPNGDTPASTRGRPAVSLASEGRVELCVHWAYDDGRAWPAACVDGAEARTWEGRTFCCTRGSGELAVRVASATSPSGSVLTAETDGLLLIRAAGDGAAACTPYRITVAP